MKQSADAIIKPEQAEYLDQLLPKSNALLAEMEAHAHEHRVPIADREVAWFLEITARAMNAKRVLEIGMAIGYAVIHLLQGMDEEGLVVTIEPNEEMIRQASGYIERAGFSKRVRLEQGFALEVLPRLTDTFDIVYLDALKTEYADYLDLSLPLLRTGGVVIADNLLWGGQVAGGPGPRGDNDSTEALRAFNQKFVNHPQLKAEVLSVGDGLGYGVKVS